MSSITDKLRTYLFKNGKWVLVTSKNMLYDGCYVKQVEKNKPVKYYKVHKILDDSDSRYWFENIRYSSLESFKKAQEAAKKYVQNIISKKDDFLVVEGVDKSEIEKYKMNTNLSGFGIHTIEHWGTDLWKGARHIASESWKSLRHIGHTVHEIGKEIGKAIHWIGKHWVTIVIIIVAIVCIYALCAYASEVGWAAVLSSSESAAGSAVSAGAQMVGQVAEQVAYQWVMSKLYSEEPEQMAQEGGDPDVLNVVDNYSKQHGIAQQEILDQTYQYVAKYSGQFIAAGFKKPEQAVVYILRVNNGSPPDPNEIITDYLIITEDGKVYPKYKIVNGKPVLNTKMLDQQVKANQLPAVKVSTVSSTPKQQAEVVTASTTETSNNKVFIYAALAALALGLLRKDGGKQDGQYY